MSIDDFLPQYHFNEVHRIRVHAPIEQVYRAFKEVTVGELSPLVQLLFDIRSLPARLSGKRGLDMESRRPLLQQMCEGDFLVLEEAPPGEIVFGSIGKPWQAAGNEPLNIETPEDFSAFADLAYARIAANFTLVEEESGQVRVSTETRVEVRGEAERRRFALYWLIICTGSGLIRIFWLRAIKHRAEKS